jgi:hypothetical protein
MLRKTLLLLPFLVGGKLYFSGGKSIFKPQLHVIINKFISSKARKTGLSLSPEVQKESVLKL